MSRGLNRALDDCLNDLDQGRPPSACLERYPSKRADLEPLLQTAARLRQRNAALQIAPDALARARERVLTQARQRALDLDDANRNRAPLPRWRLSHATLILACAVVLLLGLLGGGMAVSARSLPGDPLYGLKRTSENVRLALVRDGDERAALERHLEEERLNEVLAVVDQHRLVTVDFSGPVEHTQADSLIVQGLEVQMDEACTLDAPPEIGARVHVVAETKPDGSVVASAITLLQATQPSPEPAPASVVETHTPLPGPSHTASQQPATPTLRAATATPACSATPTPVPTDPPVAHEAPAQPTSRPAPVEPPSPQPPKPMPDTAATHAPPSDVGAARIQGEIEAIDGDAWVVAGQRILVDAATRVAPPHLTPAVGLRASVHAVPQTDGQLLAEQITLLPNPQEPKRAQALDVVAFEGTIEALSDSEWTVAGRRLAITAQTRLEGTPALGAHAVVRALITVDPPLTALEICVAALPAPGAPASATPTPTHATPGPRSVAPGPLSGHVKPAQ